MHQYTCIPLHIQLLYRAVQWLSLVNAIMTLRNSSNAWSLRKGTPRANLRNKPLWIRTTRIPKVQLHAFWTMKRVEVFHQLHSWPYRNLQTMENWVYSSLHSEESVIAERCFVQLKMWFPVLRYTVTVDLQNVISIGLITCCVVLHNVAKYWHCGWAQRMR